MAGQQTRLRVGPQVSAGEQIAKVGGKSRSHPLVAVIVKFNAPSLAAYEGQIPGLAATSAAATGRRLDPTSDSSRHTPATSPRSGRAS